MEEGEDADKNAEEDEEGIAVAVGHRVGDLVRGLLLLLLCRTEN